eukprot:gene36134-45590_t
MAADAWARFLSGLSELGLVFADVRSNPTSDRNDLLVT